MLLAYACNEPLTTLLVLYVDFRCSARPPSVPFNRQTFRTHSLTLHNHLPDHLPRLPASGSFPPLFTAIEAGQMTSKAAVNDTNEHPDEWQFAAASWTPTGKATDRSTPYFSTSLPRLTHKLLYAIAYTTPDNRLLRLPAIWRNSDNCGERDVALDIGVVWQTRQYSPAVKFDSDVARRHPYSNIKADPSIDRLNGKAEINGRLE